MNFLVSFFIPSVLGIKVLYELDNKKMSKWDLGFYYLMILMFTNCIAVVMSKLFFGLTTNLEEVLLSSPIFSVKYIILSIIISVILGVVSAIFRKYVSISLKVEKNAKKKN